MIIFEYCITQNQTNFRLSSLLRSLENNNSMTALNLKIIVANNCQATIIDDLTIEKLQLELVLQEHSVLKLYGDLSVKNTTLEKSIIVFLKNQGAHADVFYAGIAQKNQQIKITSKQHHLIKNTRSNFVVKMILKNTAKLNCNALIRIEESAEGVTAKQVNKNLILSPQAHAITSPKLEVLSHNVKCSHGAAVSHIDPEQLFFLQSRGFTQAQGKSLLTKAFLQIP